ncbi:hypothetical protein OBBRIDRAFT_831007 [Obba rivulosa]|uniref:Uncharacterized protein n=1 Tax=Obba rivulosa TaxID=1052685 RepID=A0A8E2DT48_9APHY|nr:hypothetical protein OBBRIDRAFT_831007 [Obba rivulosa]
MPSSTKNHPGPDAPFRLNDCKVTLKVTKDSQQPTVLKLVSVTADHPHLGTVARLLFNKFGELKEHWIKDDLLKGTGYWGCELDEGMLFYLTHVHVMDESNHFRRIGRPQFLAYSPDPGHPSHMILARDDVEDSYKWRGSWTNAPIPTSDGQKSLSGSDMWLVQECRKEEHDPQAIRKKDHVGMTPIHVAAASLNITATKTLLDLGVDDDLLDRDNRDMMTPLMACRVKLEADRECAQRGGPQWLGHPEHGLDTEAVLKRAMSEAVGSDVEYVQQKKWGCTCGQCTGGWLSPRVQCTGGWLSPRVQYCLQGNADYTFDSMFDCIMEEDYEPLEPDVIEMDLWLA